jgi:hypothetical protein
LSDHQKNDNHADAPLADAVDPARRSLLKRGIRAAFVLPVVTTFSAKQALAAGSNLSCYPEAHACPGLEACCDGLVCTGGQCTVGTACGDPGALCDVNADCCSNDCDFGTCN